MLSSLSIAASVVGKSFKRAFQKMVAVRGIGEAVAASVVLLLVAYLAKGRPSMSEFFREQGVAVLLILAASWAGVFVVHLALGIGHFSFEKHGGFRAYIRNKLGPLMGPVLLMVGAFFLLAIGSVWLAVNLRSAVDAEAKALNDQIAALRHEVNQTKPPSTGDLLAREALLTAQHDRLKSTIDSLDQQYKQIADAYVAGKSSPVPDEFFRTVDRDQEIINEAEKSLSMNHVSFIPPQGYVAPRGQRAVSADKIEDPYIRQEYIKFYDAWKYTIGQMRVVLRRNDDDLKRVEQAISEIGKNVRPNPSGYYGSP